MNVGEKLEEYFQDYLASGYGKKASKLLANSLRDVGLLDEGNAVAQFIKHGPVEYTLGSGVWEEHSCWVDFYPPANAKLGALWFDIVELVPMIYVSYPRVVPDPPLKKLFSKLTPKALSDLPKVWLALRPTQVWQFRVFLKQAKYRLLINCPENFMQYERFETLDSMSYITGLYFTEAVVYSRWFRKDLSTSYHYGGAQELLEPNTYQSLIPNNMRLWSGQASGDTDYRVTIKLDRLADFDTLKKEYLYWHEAGYEENPSRILYVFWDHDSKLGFSTGFDGTKALPLAGHARKWIEMDDFIPRKKGLSFT